MRKHPKDLMCHKCFDNEADNLLYFKKSYNNGKCGISHPALLCKQCADNQLNSDRLFESQPVMISFERIALAEMAKVMWLCSYKNKECNDMGNKVWRKKILRIKKYSEGKRRSDIKKLAMPMAI